MNPASGFGNAPISKAILVATAGTSIFSQANKIFRPALQWVAFKTPGELLAGCFLVYVFRVLERQWGSAKYGGFVCVATGLSAALQALAARVLLPLVKSGAAAATTKAATRVAGGLLGSKLMVSGPYGLLFACMVQFALSIPPSNKFTLLGLRMSDKFFVYVAGLQLVVATWPASLLASGTGALVGLLYRVNFLGLKRFRLPGPINRFFAKTIGQLLQDPRQQQQQPGAAAAPAGARGAAAAGGQPGGARARSGAAAGPAMGAAAAVAGGASRRGAAGGAAAQAATAATALPAADPEKVEQLVAMGFDRERAARALQMTHPPNNVDQAVSLLVG